ncbi:MAG: signal transduction histidine kinase [Rhodospirillales bacterium]|nr:signal transduction histidine kinase [Rhodospirillales bacterium]
MPLPEFTRSTTFQWAIAIAGAFATGTLVLFGFVYWETATYMTARIDSVIGSELTVIAAEPPELRMHLVDTRLEGDPRRIKVAGLFAADGRRIAGNVERRPSDLTPDGKPHDIEIVRLDVRGSEPQMIRAVALNLPDNGLLVIGRNIDELGDIADIVERALTLGILPALAIAIAAGVLLSLRAQRRLEAVVQTVRRIVAGDLRERLPVRGAGDPFDQLALIVNGMLDEIEGLIQEISGVGDDIAHEVRTPLTRVRASLERGRENAATLEELRAIADRAIGGLDKSLAIVTALLRIAEIEHGRRLAGFGEVELAGVMHEVAELYDPVAEDRHVQLDVEATDIVNVRGDHDLLFEAIANLVDNAIKFTPANGRVELKLLKHADDIVIRISDTGSGINETERDFVTRRFYRSDKSRCTQGVGLGLSLVAAIIKLHGFRLAIGAGPGCTIEIIAPRA